jgi:hypothetical protein
VAPVPSSRQVQFRRTKQEPRCQDGHGTEQDALGTEPPGEGRGKRGEHAQQRDGDSGQHRHRPPRQRDLRGHLREYGGETGKDGPQI